jgi:hypothetical protein
MLSHILWFVLLECSAVCVDCFQNGNHWDHDYGIPLHFLVLDCKSNLFAFYALCIFWSYAECKDKDVLLPLTF